MSAALQKCENAKLRFDEGRTRSADEVAAVREVQAVELAETGPAESWNLSKFLRPGRQLSRNIFVILL